MGRSPTEHARGAIRGPVERFTAAQSPHGSGEIMTDGCSSHPNQIMNHRFSFARVRGLVAKLCCSIVLFAAEAHAQWVQTAGPLGADLRALFVVGPNLYAGTSAGAFVTSNNGATWTEINSGITPYSTVYSFNVSGPNLLAGTTSGLFLSTNGGATWRPVDFGQTVGTVFAITRSGAFLFAGANAGVLCLCPRTTA